MALAATSPALDKGSAFGLSTDYAVFLLSRIKEALDNGASDSESVAIGLERTGRIVTAAGPFVVGSVAAHGTYSIQHALFWIGVVPLVGLLFLPLVIETKGRALRD